MSIVFAPIDRASFTFSRADDRAPIRGAHVCAVAVDFTIGKRPQRQSVTIWEGPEKDSTPDVPCGLDPAQSLDGAFASLYARACKLIAADHEEE